MSIDGSPKTLERIAGFEDSDALMLAKLKQIAVAGDDGIGASGERTGDDVIVVGISRYDAGNKHTARGQVLFCNIHGYSLPRWPAPFALNFPVRSIT